MMTGGEEDNEWMWCDCLSRVSGCSDTSSSPLHHQDHQDGTERGWERESLWDDVEWIDHTQKGEGERLIDLPRSSSRVFRSKNLVSLSSFRQMTSRVLKRFEIAREENLHAKMFFLGWRIACFSSLCLLSYRVDKHYMPTNIRVALSPSNGMEREKENCHVIMQWEMFSLLQGTGQFNMLFLSITPSGPVSPLGEFVLFNGLLGLSFSTRFHSCPFIRVTERRRRKWCKASWL